MQARIKGGTIEGPIYDFGGPFNFSRDGGTLKIIFNNQQN